VLWCGSAGGCHVDPPTLDPIPRQAILAHHASNRREIADLGLWVSQGWAGQLSQNHPVIVWGRAARFVAQAKGAVCELPCSRTARGAAAPRRLVPDIGEELK
jgi:hypothetical protein